tara:strand:- start:3538 stop:4194 length:657 start_codon:yes stop_codon:yes gene_type:complete
MCAPKNDLAKLAIIGAAAYASGGTSLFATSSASTAATASATNTTILSTLANAAKVALPVIGAAGQVYSGYMNAQMLRNRANFTDYQVGVEEESFALRKVKRQRALAQQLGKQRALYGLSGVTIEGSPGDILAQTRANYAEDEFIDAYNTSQSILSKKFSSTALRSEAKTAIIGGYTNAATTLGTRGDIFTTVRNKPNVGPNSEITKTGAIRTATEGSN